MPTFHKSMHADSVFGQAGEVFAMHCGAALHRAGNGESSEAGEFRNLQRKLSVCGE